MYGSLVDADSNDYVRKEIWAVPVHKKSKQIRGY